MFQYFAFEFLIIFTNSLSLFSLVEKSLHRIPQTKNAKKLYLFTLQIFIESYE